MSSTTDLDVQRIHDLLLREKPSEASHDASLCPLCEESHDGDDTHADDTSGGDVTTYTQADLDNAVAEAVAPLQAKLDALLEEQGQAEVENRITELTEAHEAKVAELQAEIDSAVAAAEAAKAERDELVQFLADAQAAQEAEAAAEARKAEIKEAVAGLFSEERIEERLETWASLEPEAFETILADAKAAAEAAKAAKVDDADDKTPAVSTAMQHGSDAGTTDVSSIRQSLYGRGNDVRTVGASITGGLA